LPRARPQRPRLFPTVRNRYPMPPRRPAHRLGPAQRLRPAHRLHPAHRPPTALRPHRVQRLPDRAPPSVAHPAPAAERQPRQVQPRRQQKRLIWRVGQARRAPRSPTQQHLPRQTMRPDLRASVPARGARRPPRHRPPGHKTIGQAPFTAVPRHPIHLLPFPRVIPASSQPSPAM
jgi:hypothetical protein